MIGGKGQLCRLFYFRVYSIGRIQGGNELLSDRRIEEKLSANISFTLMQQLRETLLVKLAGYFPLYTGYAGVDMMICETAGGYRVQPCVEINMRMNMGVAAHLSSIVLLILPRRGSSLWTILKAGKRLVVP